jgi:kynurenine formamidase
MKQSIAKGMEEYDVVDLTHTLEEQMPRPQVPYGHVPWKSEAAGDRFNTYMLVVFEHTGTHVDAPIHLAGIHGATIDKVMLDRWMGPINCLDMTHKGARARLIALPLKIGEGTGSPTRAIVLVPKTPTHK